MEAAEAGIASRGGKPGSVASRGQVEQVEQSNI